MTCNILTEAAKTIATNLHEGQTRWGGEPYITHPERVAKSLEKYAHKLVVATGWLHDTIEDCDISIDELAFMIVDLGVNEEIANSICCSVDILSKREGESYLQYILRVIQSKNTMALLVKNADLTDNLSDLKKGAMRDKYELARHMIGVALANNRYDE